MQVLRSGKPFLVANRRALTEFQMYAPVMYFDWKVCRRRWRRRCGRALPMSVLRHVAVHNYRDLDPAIVSGIAADHLGDLETFANQYWRERSPQAGDAPSLGAVAGTGLLLLVACTTAPQREGPRPNVS